MKIKFIEALSTSRVMVSISTCEFKSEEFLKRIAEHDVMLAITRVLEEYGVYIESPGIREEFCTALVMSSNTGSTNPMLELIERYAKESLYKSMRGQSQRIFDLSDASERMRYNSLVSGNSLSSWVISECIIHEDKVAC